MKGFKTAAIVGGVVLAGVGVAMAVTNPAQTAYEEYAVQKLTEYVKGNFCQKAGFFENQCAAIVDSGQSEFKQAIAQNTQRQNFIFFSIYTTNLSVTPLLPSRLTSVLPALPSYQFETAGVLQSFYTYQAKQK